MDCRSLIRSWFEKWESGDFETLPLSDDFQHTSPYGLVDGKADYLSLIKGNRAAFLGKTFKINEEVFDGNRAVVRYTMATATGTMEISEWFHCENDLIKAVISYYNISKS